MSELINYKEYKLTTINKCYGGVLGSVIGGMMLFIIYKHLLVCIIGGFIGSVVGIKKYKRYLLNKRNTQLLIEFRECLDFLNANYLVGKNTLHSFQEAVQDCYMQFGESSYFYRELNYIVTQQQHGQTIEYLLVQLSKRMAIAEVTQFVYVFVTVYRQGGDLKQVIENTKDVLTRKINMTLDIQTILFEQKRQITILLIMPYILLSLIDMFGLFVGTPTDFKIAVIRTIAMALFMIGYWLAKYMVITLEREI